MLPVSISPVPLHYFSLLPEASPHCAGFVLGLQLLSVHYLKELCHPLVLGEQNTYQVVINVVDNTDLLDCY